MGNDAMAHRVATGLFNFNGKLSFQPKNKFSLLILIFLNLCLLAQCLLDAALKNLCLTVTLFFGHFYNYITPINLCFLTINRYRPGLNIVTSLKLVITFILVYFFILILVDLAKILKNAFHPKLINNLLLNKLLLNKFLLIILLSSLHLNDLSLTLRPDYNRRWSSWLYIDGDIEENPGPKTEHFRFFHWNVNSLPAHNFSRLSLIQAYNALHDFHIMAISESALNLAFRIRKLKFQVTPP